MNAHLLPQPVEVQTRQRRGGAALEHPIPGFARPAIDADRAQWNAAFEDAYASVAGDLSLVPWGRSTPDPLLVAWLDARAPGLVRPGASVAIVGCGAGDDVAELAARGYDITAIDVSPTAVDWARTRFPHIADCFLRADLLDNADRERPLRRADLVIAVELFSWLPPAPSELRPQAAAAIATLVRPRGMLTLVCACGGDTASDDPGSRPCIAPEEIAALMEAQGMMPLEPLADCIVQDPAGASRLCAAFRHA